MKERAVEFLPADDCVVLAIRPPLGVPPDDARILRKHGGLVLHLVSGRGRVSLPVPEDVGEMMRDDLILQVVEFEIDGEEPVRETDLPVRWTKL